MSAFPIPTLTGSYVRLEALTEDLVDALFDAANEDRSTYGLTSVPASREGAETYVRDMTHMWEREKSSPLRSST